MNQYLYIPPTLSAIFATAGQRPRFAWLPQTRLTNIAAHYQAYRLRLRWDTQKRATIVDVNR